jgi:hypothetical protein
MHVSFLSEKKANQHLGSNAAQENVLQQLTKMSIEEQ